VGKELLFGRNRELGVLQDLLAGVKAGEGATVLVVGEQGVGKSSLLRAGVGGAEDQGGRLLWGVADELGQRIPLWLMSEIVAAAGAGPAGGAGLGAAGSEGAADPVAAGAERLLAAVDRLCAESPVVLVAEDLQWADEASALVWLRLCRAVAQLPLLLVGSCRSGATVLRLHRGVTERGGVVLDIDPLGDRDVRALTSALAGGRPGPRLLGLLERAGGNPLYARELVDGLVRDGRVRVSGGVAELAEGAGTRAPASLAAAVGSRLAGLTDDAMQALRWAALLGAEFTVADLGVVSGRSARDLIPVLQAAMSAGVLAEAGMRLAFRHNLIRQVLYEGMPAALRVALHLQAARMLADAGALAERVAAQLMSAGLDPERAAAPVDSWVVEWLAGAAPALTYRVPEVAENILRAVLDQLPAGDPRRADLEANLVAVLFRLEKYREAEQSGERLLAGDTDQQRIAETTWLVAYATQRTGQVDEAIAQIERGLARPGLSEPQKARLLSLHAMTLTSKGEFDQAEVVARQALAAAEVGGDRLAAGYTLHALSNVAFHRLDETERREYIDRALAVTELDPQATDLRLLLLGNKTFHLSSVDRPAEAMAVARQAVALAERAGTPRVQRARFGLANLHFGAGEWDDALAELEQASDVSESAVTQALVHGLRALIAGHRGERELAARLLREADDLNLRSNVPPVALYLLRLATALAAEQDGRLDDAIAELGEFGEPGNAERIPGVSSLVVPLVRLALANGDREIAEAAARAAEEECEHQPLRVEIAMTNHCRGLVAADPALVLSAADYFREIGDPFGLALALEDAAAIEVGRGEVALAQEHLAEAVGLYSGLGAAWDVERASARLEPFGVRPVRSAYRTRPASGWESLTPTEVKVAYLVGDGRSNPDVAAELFLSRNTVQTHVSHILAKLGARSRTEIIREAVRHPATRHPVTRHPAARQTTGA
jgi:DNA-binding CsgD family transcriptional regulator/tetratricopeptide (TPR) repeat protein